ncbi:ribonuclease E [Corynebacterium striatum]|nr:ribonuclease E [Corynebacterium striatum]
MAKDPIGHKGARLTTRFPWQAATWSTFQVAAAQAISRKLPVPERKRLKGILERVIPGDGGAIIRTAAENVSEEAIATDVNRLHNLWEDITKRSDHEKSTKGAKPVTLYEEPDLLVKVVRDLPTRTSPSSSLMVAVPTTPSAPTLIPWPTTWPTAWRSTMPASTVARTPS